MYINDADMLVTPYYQYAYSLPHDDVSLKFQIVKFGYVMLIYALEFMLEL